MIISLYMPKGGVGKTSLTKQLKMLIPGMNLLDLDHKNGVMHFDTTIDQPSPAQIDVDFLKGVLPSFRKDRDLIIDMGGYVTSTNSLALAYSDLVIAPMLQGKANTAAIANLNKLLTNLENQTKRKKKCVLLWNKIAWNSNINRLNSPYKEYDKIQFLSFGIVRSNAIQEMHDKRKPTVDKGLQQLMEVIENARG